MIGTRIYPKTIHCLSLPSMDVVFLLFSVTTSFNLESTSKNLYICIVSRRGPCRVSVLLGMSRTIVSGTNIKDADLSRIGTRSYSPSILQFTFPSYSLTSVPRIVGY